MIQLSSVNLGKLQHTYPEAPPRQWSSPLLPGQIWSDTPEDPADPTCQAQCDAVHQPQVPSRQGPQRVWHQT